MTREEARKIAIRYLTDMLVSYGENSISHRCPKPGKNSWTWKEQLDAVINDVPLEGDVVNFIDDILAIDRYFKEHGMDWNEENKIKA